MLRTSYSMFSTDQDLLDIVLDLFDWNRCDSSMPPFAQLRSGARTGVSHGHEVVALELAVEQESKFC